MHQRLTTAWMHAAPALTDSPPHSAARSGAHAGKEFFFYSDALGTGTPALFYPEQTESLVWMPACCPFLSCPSRIGPPPFSQALGRACWGWVKFSPALACPVEPDTILTDCRLMKRIPSTSHYLTHFADLGSRNWCSNSSLQRKPVYRHQPDSRHQI